MNSESMGRAAAVAVPAPTDRLLEALARIAAAEDLAAARALCAQAQDAAAAAAQKLAQLEHTLADRTAALVRAQDEIRQHAVTDELTDLANRRGFYILAEHALLHGGRRGLPCLAVKLDVDGLARINERLGHNNGDALLVEVAHMLRDMFRASDVVARLDGDEFCVLVLDPGDDAQVIRRRIDERVAHINRRSGKPFALALHLGIAVTDPDSPAPLDELLARADQALYSVKQRARRSAA
jgi:diguanylate cyclase (GGDEF)-like protein